MKKLCIIVPTHNRHECIEYYLSCKAKFFKELSIDMIIYDSSTEINTEQVVDSYIQQGYSNIIYDQYSGDDTGRSIDHKVYSAYKKYSQLYDYIWFSSDGTVLNAEMFLEEINELMNNNFDMIVVRKSKGLDKLNTSVDIIPLFHDYCWSMTLLCSVISSSRIAQQIINKYPVKKGCEFWLWFPSVYFYILPNSDYKVATYQTEKLYAVNDKRSDSFWKESGNALWQWCKVWCNVIDAFPTYYDGLKNYVIRSHDKNTRIFSMRGLVHLKATGNLSYFKVKEQAPYIERVTSTNIALFYMISILVPRKLILLVKKCYYKVKHVV